VKLGQVALPATAFLVAIGLSAPAFAAKPKVLPKPSVRADRIAEAREYLRRVLGGIRSLSIISGAPQHPGPATTQDVCEGLTCQCGCGLTVANCNHPTCGFAVPMRTQIDGMIKASMTRAEIITAFRNQYGEKVLSAPTTEGFNILAWTMPFAALLGGAVLIMFAAGRWRSAAPPRERRTSDSPFSNEFDPRLKRLLERELRERL